MSPLKLIFILALIVVVIAFICYVEMGQRRIPITYAKRIQGRKMMGGQSTFLPLKVNTGGVIPIIFASSVITFPATILQFIKHPIAQKITQQLTWGMPLYNLLYITSIIFFTYFYISIIFNPKDVSDNLQKYGGFIPGIRAGKNTSEYIDSVLSKLTFIGAIYLVLVALLPEFLMTGFKVGALPFVGDFLEANLPRWFYEGFNVQVLFRRHVDPDRGRRGHGYGAADRSPADHAQLRLFLAQRADSRAARMKRLILFGAPGSGKGTMGELIQRDFGLRRFPPETSCAPRSSRTAPKACKAKGFMAAGGLVPDELVIEMVRQRLSRGDLDGGYITGRLSAHPGPGRSAFARRHASGEKAIFIEVSENEAVERLLSRLTCRDCGAIYNLRTKPPRKAGVCDLCGGRVERRADDNEEAVRQRFRVYVERTLPVIDYYDRKDVLARVDGSGAGRPGLRKDQGADRMIMLKTDQELER